MIRVNRGAIIGMVVVLPFACWAPAADEVSYEIQARAVDHLVQQTTSQAGTPPIAVYCLWSESADRVQGATDSVLAQLATSNRVVRGGECQIGDGLTERGTGTPALGLFVEGPAVSSWPHRARVTVTTSTGGHDLASFVCRLRRTRRSWQVVRCALEAIT